MANKAKISKSDVRAAMDELRKAGKNYESVSAIREALGGVGSNDTIQKLRDECLAEMATEAAASRKLTPSQQAMALQLMERAVSGIAAELEADALTQIQECKAAAAAEIQRNQAHAQESLIEAGRRVSERDQVMAELSEAKELQQRTRDEVVRLMAMVEGRDAEISKLMALLDRAQAERDLALSTAAELRGMLVAAATGAADASENADLPSA